MEVIETDDYGRRMFIYTTYDDTKRPIGLQYAVMIAQRTDEEYSYYYPDYCFITFENKEDIDDEKTKELKEANDWNKEFDETKCKKSKIVRQKKVIDIKEKLYKNICDELNSDNKYKHFYNYYFISDDYGRKLYNITANDFNNDIFDSYVVIFGPKNEYDKETGIIKIEDYYNYQDQLKAFKDANNWDKPLE